MSVVAPLGGDQAAPRGFRDVLFAVGVLCILTILLLPLPPVILDIGLATSIAFAVLILMVALWIDRPLDFSSFPTILLIATMLRLALNIATTRLILTHGSEGHDAAGHVIAGFANFVMGGDFVIGLVVFVILITVNFVVITKGATRMAEVGARFTLDAIPGKQMAIDADLSAGSISETEAQRRRSELEEESAFFGAMDGASKFVRGDAIAGIVITAVNIFGGIIIGVTRHGISLGEAADVYVKLSVGDGLVTQVPALIISLAAGLLISKGGTRGSAEKAVVGQLSYYPRALLMASLVLILLALAPGLPFLPFALLAASLGFIAYIIPVRRAEEIARSKAKSDEAEATAIAEEKQSVRKYLKVAEIEVCLGKQLSSVMLLAHGQLATRVVKMRRKFAEQYGFVIPDIRLTDDVRIAPKDYLIRMSGTTVAHGSLRPGDVLVVTGDGKGPDVPGLDETKEPAFGMKAVWVPEIVADKVRRDGFKPIDIQSVLLTHLAETIRNNLSQLLSYKDVRRMMEGLEPEYKRLLDEIVPSMISFSGLQAVFKLLLAERVSIRNLHLILEAIAEVLPHARRSEQISEHVRVRLASQICGELAEDNVLNVLRLGARWELAFHQAIKRDGKGEVIEFDMEPRLIEQFGSELAKFIGNLKDTGQRYALVVSPESRPFVRMMTERLFSTLAVLSHAEIARGIQLRALGSIS